MRMPSKHVLRQIAAGNPPDLATWLNGSQQSPVVKQIAAILDALGEVNAEAHIGQRTLLRAQLEKLGAAMKTLNRLIRRNPIQIKAHHTSHPPTKIILAHQTSDSLDSMILLQVITASSSGKLDLLRRCSNCRKWFFAERQTGRFCDDRCYKSWYKKKPENRLKWNAFMRRYRATSA